VLWISSFIWGEAPTHRRYAHSHHHTHTWHWQVDAQMGYRNPVKLRTYLGDIIGLVEFWPRLQLTVRHALGRIVERERVYVPAVAVPRMILEARVLLAGYVALLAWAALGQTWVPLLYFFIPRFAGAFGVFLFITTQHMAMNQDVNDHRENTRSMRNGWFARLLYWNMNYHIEHHVYPSVPFHALPALNEAIRDQLPEPCPGLYAAHREILGTILEQRRDPAAFVRHPIPGRDTPEASSRAVA
jgi:fatty acid desaturase